MTKRLRSGFTTGACAAAAARAAVQALITRRSVDTTPVKFPDGSTVEFAISDCRLGHDSATAFVIKDAGDDPDVTNGARIGAEVRLRGQGGLSIQRIDVKGGIGVGTVTKPGLAVEVGQPAINPVPLQMIRENVSAALSEAETLAGSEIEIVVLVPDGLELAKKTLNERLGIIGGISILGTTGIVRPVSADAWTGTIRSSMAVAEANGIKEIILSTGRTSEKCVERLLRPPQEALVMMGDYLAFALKEAAGHSFTRVHIATMWAKLLKGVLGYGQTHVRHGALDTRQVCSFLKENRLAVPFMDQLETANTAREILDIMLTHNSDEIIHLICRNAAKRYQATTGLPVSVHLVHNNRVLLSVH